MPARLPGEITEAIRLLYAQEGGAIYRTVYAILLDATPAQRVTREAFLRAGRTWERFDPAGARAGLLRIAVDLAITQAEAGKAGGHDLVAWLMRPLTAEQRALIALTYYQHVPRAEIADELGLPAGTVGARLGQAMLVLRRRARGMGAAQAMASATP